ncbi:Uncharacterised protein [Corynebacterium renale]|uniref:Uncharacterized protein n=1 Tax=Corynebacterium renale TaxID=1724 RepID=A0A2A9DLH6_9CORY|nr:hypothetical protein ATK06_0668 [Corynebacterium renale]SQI22987.1 Uncharacterised protein [Corynebacterium renale]
MTYAMRAPKYAMTAFIQFLIALIGYLRIAMTSATRPSATARPHATRPPAPVAKQIRPAVAYRPCSSRSASQRSRTS